MCVGISSLPSSPSGLTLPSTALSHNTAYHTMSEALGGRGILVTTLTELSQAVQTALRETALPTVINVIIEKEGKRKQQKHDWLTKTTTTPQAKL